MVPGTGASPAAGSPLGSACGRRGLSLSPGVLGVFHRARRRTLGNYRALRQSGPAPLLSRTYRATNSGRSFAA